MNRAAQEPCKDGSTASAQPKTAGEVCPTRTGEQIRRGVVDCDVGGWNVGLFSGLVVQQEQQAEDVNSTNGGQQTGGLLILGGTQRATDGERAEEQITERCARFQATEVRGNPRAVQGQVVDQSLDEITAVDGGRKIADAGISSRSDSHELRVLRG